MSVEQPASSRDRDSIDRDSIDRDSIDSDSVDKALMSTRAVRRRLDLDRPVDHQIILDCIDVAEQAPSGGNQGSRRWLIIEDQRTKDALAEIYLESAGQWMIESHEKIAGTGHPQEKVMASAAHLAKHLAEVPVIVIPTIIGVHDNSGRPGLFDSVIQSAWSFCVALRARGLGSAWTTAIFSRQDEIADLLDIPEGMTQIAMLPVAWMTGTKVKVAPRLPARQIAYFDGFARTWEQGPSDPPRHSDGPGAVVETDIKAPAATVWPFVTDISFGADHSSEFTGARWADGSDGACARRPVHWIQHPRGHRRVGGHLLRRPLRARPYFRLGDVRSRQSRRPVALRAPADRRRNPTSLSGDHRPRAFGNHGCDRAHAGQGSPHHRPPRR